MSDITRDYSFGGWLRHIRIEKELTLREAARRLGVDAGNLSKLERSELDPPRNAARVKEICAAYGCMEAESILLSTAYQHHVGRLKREFESKEAALTDEACVMATDKPNHNRTGCEAEGDVFERDRKSSVVGRDMNSDCKLLLGDCLDVLKDVKSGSVGMVLADLPYGTTGCKWDSVVPFEPLWAQLERICKTNAVLCLFGVEPFSSKLRLSNQKLFKYDWVWVKSRAVGFVNAKLKPMNKHEIISVFSSGKTSNGNKNNMPYFPQGLKPFGKVVSGHKKSHHGDNDYFRPSQKEKRVQDFTGYPTSILEFGSEMQTVHPTQKPVALLEYLIKTYTNEGDTVLDPTMGSGSTGVACKNLGRKFIGIEMDANYFAIAKRRIEDCNLQAEFK